MDSNQILEQFYNNGFVRINDPEMLKFIDIESMTWTDPGHIGLQIVKRNDEVNASLDKTQEALGKKYVHELDSMFKYSPDREIVNGMDEATLSWHNDLVEGPNLCVLLYFDSMDADIGGAISFRNRQTTEHIATFYPQAGDVVIMNHGLKFEHIVSPLKIPLHRRVASLNFYVNELITS